MNEDFERINKLGFQVTINWGDFININLELPEEQEDDGSGFFASDVPVLMYYHPKLSNYDFGDSFGSIVDEFNRWYSQNLSKINSYRTTGLLVDKVKIKSLGDITQAVQRNLKIEDVIY